MREKWFCAALLSGVLLMGGSAAQAQVVAATLDEFGGAVNEGFEGVTGVYVPDSNAGPLYGAPPPGFIFGSGLEFTLPTTNDSIDSPFIIGNFSLGNAAYGLGDNGQINSSSDLHGGQSYAATGGPSAPFLRFTFPSPVDRVGAFFSTYSLGGNPIDLRLRLIGAGNVVLGSVTFPSSLPIGLDDTNFLGVRSLTYAAVAVDIVCPFVAFDDLRFVSTTLPNSTAAAPEPGALALLALGGLGLMARRRK